MVALKAHQVAAFLKSPDAGLRAILIYGTDAGLVSERARDLAMAFARRQKPEGEIVRLDDTDLESDPDRLMVEAETMPMFGGPKVIRAAAGRRISAATLRPLLEGPPLNARLIVEAGNLRPDESLRALFEKSPNACALPCFGDEAQDLDALITAVLSGHGQRIGADARVLLASRLGADRALSRAEIEKLALYAGAKPEIDEDDIEAIVGDTSSLDLDKATSAAASGNAGAASTACERVIASGESAQSVIAATQRYFLRLHRARAEIDAGRSADDVLRFLRPPLPFKMKATFGAQLRLWDMARLSRALAGISQAAKAARLKSALEEPLAVRLLADLARLAKA